MSGQCKVEQRARRLIFNSVPTALSWAHTWTKAFLPSASTHRGRFLQSALNYSPREGSTQAGRLGGAWGVDGKGRWAGRAGRPGAEPSPRSESSQGLLGGRGAGTRVRPCRLAPPGRTLRDTSATEKGSGGKRRAGLLTQRRQSPASGSGFPVPPALSAADTLRERKPWRGRELQLCPRTKPSTKPEFG